MMTTPEEAEQLTKEQLYARLLDTERDRDNLRLHIHATSGQGATERQSRIVRAIRNNPEAAGV